MPRSAKFYVRGVIVSGLAVFAGSLIAWPPSNLAAWLVYLVLAMLASVVKLRLPGLTRTYSLSFLFILFGIARFSLAETLIAGCAGALVQSVWNTKKRPNLMQVLFNMSNLIVSIGVCFLVGRVLLATAMAQYRPAVLALLAFVYFVVNTLLVSGVLALLEGKRLPEVSQDWYVWSFPYYLIGAAVVGLIPDSGHAPSGEAWLLLLPLAYLVHFFVGLLQARPAAAEVKRSEDLPRAARLYVRSVIVAGVGLLVAAGAAWHSDNLVRFAAYLVLTAIASTLKVSLPGMRGTLSLNFVLRLVILAELGFTEAVLLAAVAGVVQCVWKVKRRPTVTRVLFNASCLALTTAAGYGICRLALHEWLSQSLVLFLIMATLVLYTCNTMMVSLVLCLVEQKPLRTLWQSCYFWSCPYYLAGSAAAGLMIATSKTAGWELSLAVLPIMGLVYLSYRLHVAPSSAVWGG